MKKTMLLLVLLAAALLFSGCEVVLVAPGIQPGTQVTIDDEDGVTETIDPHTAGRYELVVGAEPVRIDVYQETSSPDGDLLVTVADEGNHVKALTASRYYFVDPNKASDFTSSLGIVVPANLPYSINIPANFGKAYVMVHNETDNPITVTVKAVTRNTTEKTDLEIGGPEGAATSVSYGGAILFLGQHDTYVYTGPDNYTVSLTLPEDGYDYLHLKLRIVNTDTVLELGESAALLSGDQLEVYAEDDARAGFCDNLDGCTDGIASGEYLLNVNK